MGCSTVTGVHAARALEEYASVKFSDQPRLWHTAMLAFSFLDIYERDGWQVDHIKGLDVSILFPKAAIRVDPPTSNFANLAHRHSSLSYSFAVLDGPGMARIHAFTAARHSGSDEPYTVRRANLTITSATDAKGVTLYARSDLRHGAWSTIMVSANGPDGALLNAVTASISPGYPQLIDFPPGGQLDRSIRSLLALLEGEKGRTVTAPPVALDPGTQTSRGPSSGSGFRVSHTGHVLTNAHVVDGCSSISIDGKPATLVARTDEHDLALLLGPAEPGQAVAAFATGPARLNSDVTAAGFPLNGLLSGLNVTRGSVSSLTGLGGNLLHMQITAPLQPGNSGGPVLSSGGLVVGVAVSKLDAEYMLERYGDLPQNVNFAIRGEVARLFLMQNGVEPAEGAEASFLPPESLAERAQGFTAFVECR